MPAGKLNVSQMNKSAELEMRRSCSATSSATQIMLKLASWRASIPGKRSKCVRVQDVFRVL